MTELCYPVFEEGQTLTRDDLNGLREFFDERARQVGRAVGFGVSCGLDGRIDNASGPGLTVDAGVAIDQVGEVLLLEEGVRIPLPPLADPDFEFDFVAGGEGFTPVLVKHEVETPAPDCDEEGCEAHAATTCRSANVVIVAGRLDDPRFDFASEPLLTDSAPLAANPTAAQFSALRNAITTRLHDRISADAEAKLADHAIAGSDLEAVRNHKAAFLNQVLFAALDLLRCEALMDVACERTATQPGVALGWVHQAAGTWRWDCEWRHAWEPPPGLSIALTGGACDDACRLHRRRIEGLIATFELPIVPGPSDDPKPGDGGDSYEPCGKTRKKNNVYENVLAFEHCRVFVAPPVFIVPDWYERWKIPVPLFPPGVDPTPPWEVYGISEPDWLGEGLMNLAESYGRKADAVAPALADAMQKAGVTQPSVQVLTASEAERLPGFSPAAAASPADTVVLVADTRGKVTTTGHVPSQIGMRDAAVGVGAATATANQALGMAQEIEATVAGNAALLAEYGGQLDAFKGEIDGLSRFRVEAGKVLDGLDGLVTAKANEVLATYQGTVGPMLDNAILEAVETIEGRFSRNLEEHTENVVAPLREQVAEIGARAETSGAFAEKANARIDQVLVRRGVGGPVVGRTVADPDVVGFLRTMRGAVEATATPRRRARVETALAEGDEALERLEAAAAGEALPATEARLAVTGVLDAFASALGAAGASRRQIDELRARVEHLREPR